MKNHIIKAVAVLMAFITLMSVMPLAALAELMPVTVPYDLNGDGVIDAADQDIFESVEQGKTVSTGSYDAAMGFKGSDGKQYDMEGGSVIVNSLYSPYEPVTTDDENHPFIQNGAAWINLAELYYGAPATPNTPITKWSANTSVVNPTGTGEKFSSSLNAPIAGKEIYSLPDMNLIDEYTWAQSEATVGGEVQNGVINSKDHVPYVGEVGNATIKQTYSVTQKNGETAYVYNRYDPMQGKWGLTLDKNVSSVTWTPSWRDNYWQGANFKGQEDLNNTILYLSDTPYLYYSTEAPDTAKIAISLLIGTPVQSEYKTSKDATVNKNSDGTYPASNQEFLQTWTSEKTFNTDDGTEMAGGVTEYVYRWYTITDNSARPGIAANTRGNSMVPIVHISDPVIWDADKLKEDSASVLDALINGYEEFPYNWDDKKPGTDEIYGTTWHTGNAAKLDPIAWSTEELKGSNKTFNPETLYVSGSITGCIDFTNILPLLMDNMTDENQTSGGGRKDVRYKIAQVRVDTKTEEGAENSAIRLNYLYFGPGLSTIYTPQSTMGNTVNAANWQYAQNVASVGDDKPGGGYNEKDANDVSMNYHNTDYSTNNYDAGYTNGWENGEAVSIINTPINPQTMIIDTYGDGNGQLVDVPYKDGHTTHAVANDHSSAASSAVSTSGDHSKLWKVNVNGEEKTFEAEYNQLDGKYYIMVTIPIRKWVDVLGESRKLAMTMSVQEYGTENANNQDIGFVLWGNNKGSVGGGHSTVGTRFRGEGMLAVYGNNTYYQVDNGADYKTVLIDQTLGQSTVYNTKKVVSLFHRPNKNKEGDANQWHVEEVKNLTVYVDADGKEYYVSQGGTIYTVEPECSTETDNNGNGFPLFADRNNGNKIYYHSTAQGGICDGDGKLVTDIVSLSNMTPLYNLQEIAKTSNYDMSTLTMEYNDDEMWTDLLRSPYMYGELVKGADSKRAYGTEMQGYVFVTSLRFAMPIGAKVTVEGMKGDGNSAGLNMYSTEGTVVNAYDGGTGEQPVINVTNTLKEFEYSTSGNNIKDGGHTVNATMKNGAAAYGPYLVTSDYTIYDLLDTKSLNAGGNQSVMGTFARIKQDYDLTAYSKPFGRYRAANGVSQYTINVGGTNITSHAYGTVNHDWKSFVVYGLMYFDADIGAKATWTPEGASIWGLVGVQTSYGADYAWVKLYGGSKGSEGWNCALSDNITNYLPTLKSLTHKNVVTTGLPDGIAFAVRWEHQSDNNTNDTYLIGLYNNLKGKWMYSNFGTTYSYYPNVDSNGAYSGVQKNFSAGDVLSAGGLPIPSFANVDRGYRGENGWYNIQYNSLSATNSTQMQFKTSAGGIGDGDTWSNISMSRRLEKPFELKIDSEGSEKTYPVLYADYKGMTSNTGDEIVIYGIQVMTEKKSGSSTVYTPQVWYLGENGLTQTLPADATSRKGNRTAYFSLKPIMEQSGIEKVTVYGMSIKYAVKRIKDTAKTATGTVQRFEIWMDETDYLDVITTKDGKYHDSGYKGGNVVDVADSFNLINDAYYSVHRESETGGFEKKTNSNKGWSAQLRIDDDRDGIMETGETLYNSTSSSVDGVYEYRTSLGHLRVWVPAKKEASVAFTSDRSFNTSNYKYLYYSYSVRDPRTGIAAASSKDIPGITMALKKSNGEQDQAFLQNGYEGFIGFQTDEKYWTHETNAPDWREGTYTTTMNAAVNLQKLDNAGVDSINQIVFYMNNKNLNMAAEFYLNYVVLSNVAPNEMVTDAINSPHIQYYYLMDNTGDRYSARFPTIDNPSGAVTGLNSDNDRVNPVICDRGDYLMYGTYYNGDPLYGYGGTYGDNRTYNEEVASNGFYEKTYGCTDTTLKEGSLKNILFYMGEGAEDDYTDILDYYQYKDRNGNGTGEVQDMLWSYGRWYLGEGESAMNNMYVNDENAVTGNLTRRYATENYVLLRSGIEPRKYPTYYYAGEAGEFYYEGSDGLEGDIGNTATNNSYYITETVLNAYFMMPRDVDLQGDGNADEIIPVRYGYIFDGWEAVDGTKINNGKLRRYDRKQIPGMDYFRAKWTPDPAFTDKTFTATFFNGSGNVWVTRPAVQTDSYKIILPSAGLMWTPNGSKIVAGWEAYTDKDCTNRYMVSDPDQFVLDEQNKVVFENGKPVHVKKALTYYSASTIIMKGVNLWFKPILVDPDNPDDPNSKELITVTVTGATLKLYISGENGNFVTNDPEKQGIGVKSLYEGSNTLVYYNIPKGTAMVAYPIEGTVADGNVWTTPGESNEPIIHASGKVVPSVLSKNKDYYRFAASNRGLVINYGAAVGDTTQIGGVTTFVNPAVVNRQMTFSSQYQDVDGYTAVAYGTLYLTGAQQPKESNKANYIKYMKLDASSIDANTIKNGGFKTALSAVSQVKATAANKSNQYALTYAASTDKARTMWMRGYVIYQKNGTESAPVYEVAYSDFIVQASVGAYSTTGKTEEV